MLQLVQKLGWHVEDLSYTSSLLASKFEKVLWLFLTCWEQSAWNFWNKSYTRQLHSLDALSNGTKQDGMNDK